MKIRLEIEPNDVVRRAQGFHKQLAFKDAERALRLMQPTIERALADLKHSMLANVVDYALGGGKDADS